MSTSRRSRRPGAALLAARWLAAAAAVALTACAVGPNFVRPAPPAADHYAPGSDPTTTAEAAGEAQRFDRGARLSGDWWTLFGSEELDGLMKDAAAGNQTLQAALASLRSSQDNLRAGYGIFYPQLGLDAAASRQRVTLVRFGQTNSAATIFNLFSLSGTISYALDVFGGQRRTVESLQAQADAQAYTAAAAYVTLTANVVDTVIARASYAELARATEDLVGDQREQVEITEAQAEAGTVPYASALALRSQLSSVEATIPPLEQRVSQADHLLATLAGRLPSEWKAPPVGLSDLKLPESLPVSIASDFVHQRPDILVAEARLHQASAEVGVATAALFPNITLNASLGGNNTTLNTLFSPQGIFWSVGAGLAAPLFQGGTLVQKRRAAIDAYDQAMSDYRQSVLVGFSQVADVLRALENDADALAAEERAMSSADEALRLVRANYDSGVSNYVQVLIAFAQYHQARIGYVQARAQRLQDTVALFVALGGGWWDSGRSLLTDAGAPSAGGAQPAAGKP